MTTAIAPKRVKKKGCSCLFPILLQKFFPQQAIDSPHVRDATPHVHDRKECEARQNQPHSQYQNIHLHDPLLQLVSEQLAAMLQNTVLSLINNFESEEDEYQDDQAVDSLCG